MATPKLDTIAVNFLHRIPDEFTTAFTPGSGVMPEPNILTKDQVIDYVNRALNQLFNMYWTNLGYNVEMMIRIFPELYRQTSDINFTNGEYNLTNNYLDIQELIGGIHNNKFIKAKPSHKYLLYLTQEYDEFIPTDNNKVVIKIENKLVLFPNVTTTAVKISYLKKPISTTNGGYLAQNGNEDSPFDWHWNEQIADIAYSLFLKETNETT